MVTLALGLWAWALGATNKLLIAIVKTLAKASRPNCRIRHGDEIEATVSAPLYWLTVWRTVAANNEAFFSGLA